MGLHPFMPFPFGPSYLNVISSKFVSNKVVEKKTMQDSTKISYN